LSGSTSRRLAALLLASSVAWTPVAATAQSGPSLRPPNLKPAPDSVEAGLWGQFDKAEAYVKGSAELDGDPALTAYVKGIMCKVAPEYCGELRVYVLDRPFFNAQAAANGYVEVWSGLLIRARTEDELAYALGHEITHYARSHSLARWNDRKTKANVMLALSAVVTVGAAGAMYSVARTGAPNAGQTIDSISRAAQSLDDLIYLSGIASMFAFTREQETEADALGFKRAVAAGYDKSAGVEIWTEMIAESRASDFPDIRKSESRASVFDSHPIDSDRIKALAALGATSDLPDMQAEKRYRAAIRPHLSAWLKDDLRRRDFGQTLHLIDRLSSVGEDQGVLEFYRGEAHRERRAEGDAAAALAGYKASVTYPDAPADAWRELGDSLRKSGDKAAAISAYEGYLQHAPNADDRWIVEGELKTLSQEQAK
jgi:predicted Zn-dependent protease